MDGVKMCVWGGPDLNERRRESRDLQTLSVPQITIRYH